jgi:hypothetical protein
MSKHDPCACGCGALADECMTGRGAPLAAFTIEKPSVREECFYCRRGMHDSCISSWVPCRCCA